MRETFNVEAFMKNYKIISPSRFKVRHGNSSTSHPHHSERECARRRRQLACGMIQLSEVK